MHFCRWCRMAGWRWRGQSHCQPRQLFRHPARWSVHQAQGLPQLHTPRFLVRFFLHSLVHILQIHEDQCQCALKQAVALCKRLNLQPGGLPIRHRAFRSGTHRLSHSPSTPKLSPQWCELQSIISEFYIMQFDTCQLPKLQLKAFAKS